MDFFKGEAKMILLGQKVYAGYDQNTLILKKG